MSNDEAIRQVRDYTLKLAKDDAVFLAFVRVKNVKKLTKDGYITVGEMDNGCLGDLQPRFLPGVLALMDETRELIEKTYGQKK